MGQRWRGRQPKGSTNMALLQGLLAQMREMKENEELNNNQQSEKNDDKEIDSKDESTNENPSNGTNNSDQLPNGKNESTNKGEQPPSLPNGLKNVSLLSSMVRGDSVDSNDGSMKDEGGNEQPKPKAWVAKKNNAFWKAIALTSLDTKKDEVVKDQKKSKEVELKSVAQKLRKVTKTETERPKLKEWKAKGGGSRKGSLIDPSLDAPGTPDNNSEVSALAEFKRRMLEKKKRTLPGHFVEGESGVSGGKVDWTSKRPGGRVPNNDIAAAREK